MDFSGGSQSDTMKTRNRVSTVLLTILVLIALVVLAGLLAIGIQLTKVNAEIGALRDSSLPRLIKLSQLSQEASASIAIAPALSTNPSRFEFETLLSRIDDKRGSQAILLNELHELIEDEDAAGALQKNSDRLNDNQIALTTVVRQQIDVRKRLERHVETLRKMVNDVQRSTDDSGGIDASERQVIVAILRLQSILLDPKRARFSRNRREITAEIDELNRLVEQREVGDPNTRVDEFLQYWSEQGDRILDDKTTDLSNEFRIKALVEENSLLANRLLSSANTEFWRANAQLAEQIELIASATRFNLIAMLLVVLAFSTGAIFLWYTLQRRVLRRLDNIRDGLRQYAENRDSGLKDDFSDEIGQISRTLSNYMARIDSQEQALADKTRDLENLSTRLAKYLSPQVYESIFSGKQQVAVASSRKKLTVFFSDIVGFTELADKLESEELTQLLNQYLTEMSRIALDAGATIDKYVGDAVMIFFGDPDTKGVKEDAVRCVEMAIAMRERLSELNQTWQDSGISKPLSCRMGIHTGFCTVGNFGSEERMDYTIIGGTVNTASRLETAAEPGQILISYETYVLVRDEVDCEEHGQIEVKGIAYPVKTYTLIGHHSPIGEQSRFEASVAGVNLEINRKAMTEKDRQIALETLKRAISHLER